MNLFKANRYKSWNGEWQEGKIHAIDEREGGRLMCGKRLADIPGRSSTTGHPNCKGCLKGIESRRKQAQWEVEYQARQAEQQEKEKEWWRWYNSYLATPKWKEVRSSVLKRANGLCEGCRQKRAII